MKNIAVIVSVLLCLAGSAFAQEHFLEIIKAEQNQKSIARGETIPGMMVNEDKDVKVGRKLNVGDRVFVPKDVRVTFESSNKNTIETKNNAEFIVRNITDNGESYYQKFGKIRYGVFHKAIEFFKVSHEKYLAAVEGTVFEMDVDLDYKQIGFTAERGTVAITREKKIDLEKNQIEFIAKQITSREIEIKSPSTSLGLQNSTVISDDKTSNPSFLFEDQKEITIISDQQGSKRTVKYELDSKVLPAFLLFGEKLYFNAIPKDKKWRFYMALDFGYYLESAYDYSLYLDPTRVNKLWWVTNALRSIIVQRLNVGVEIIPEFAWLHAGWDVWGLDFIEAASMVYGNVYPGFWIKGKHQDAIEYSIAWLNLEENVFQPLAIIHNTTKYENRDLLAGYIDYKFKFNNKIRLFYAYDRIRNIPSTDLLGSLGAQLGLADYVGIYGNNGVYKAGATSPDTDVHNVGAYYLGTFGNLGLMAEGAYKFGKAKDTGLKGVYNGINTIQYDDFDIQSYAFSADLSLELKDVVGWISLKPHIGFMYTSGDKDSTDNKLSGYNGVENVQKFSGIFGGESTILSDTNFVYGSALYGYVPEFHGNGTPVFVGGSQNFAGYGNGRGDNPGITMLSVGLTVKPNVSLIYRTNVNIFNWNEDIYVSNMVDTGAEVALAGGKKKAPTKVEAGYVGTAWDNEVTVSLRKQIFIKGMFSMFFPAKIIEDVTAAISGGTEASKTSTRLAAELIWNF